MERLQLLQLERRNLCGMGDAQNLFESIIRGSQPIRKRQFEFSFSIEVLLERLQLLNLQHRKLLEVGETEGQNLFESIISISS